MLKILSIKTTEEKIDKFENFENTGSFENVEFYISLQRKTIEKIKRKEALEEAKK